jgi:hypothetical protein
MSIVDTWDWDKIDTSVYDKSIKMNADMKARTILRDFYEHYGIWPNKIIMGYRLVDELRREFFGTVVTFEEAKVVLNGDVKCEYVGIPVDIDYDNPDRLEVGIMFKWMENKYE